MSKNISISDDVYEKLKREKGDRSFSEVIEDKLAAGGSLRDVAGQGIFEPGTITDVKETVQRESDGTLERLDS
ncbi:MAG: antitoxin VapB family protein [Halodesulfurarchaeum sp.]|nr:antitoxin VapB family protein [Halodesulfurarchaeum sp.]